MHIIYFDALQESNHTFLSLPESYADDKFYLTEDDVEVIPMEDSEDWMTIGLNDGLVMAMGLKNVGSNCYYDYKGKIVLSEEKLKNNMAFSLFSEGYAVSSKGIIDKKGNFLYQSPAHLLRHQDIFFRGIIPVNTTEAKGDCRPFSEGLAIVGVYKSDKARKDKDTTQTDWSFIDEKGHVVLNLDDDYFIEPRHRPSKESLHLKSQKYLVS